MSHSVPRIRNDADRSANLLHEAPDETEAVALACGRLHQADAVIANHENGAGSASRQCYADRTNASGEGMDVCVRDNLGDDDA